MTLLSPLLQKIFFKMDQGPKAFDRFYEDLLKDSFYQEKAKELHGLEAPCYNLLSFKDLSLLKNWLKRYSEQSISLLDFGCGLSFLGTLNEARSFHISGWDFSEKAIFENTERYPHCHFSLYHLNVGLSETFDLVLITDSLYRQRDLTGTLKKILKKTRKSLFLCQNFSPSFTPPTFKGWSVSTVDVTSSFIKTIDYWKEVLLLPETTQDKSILWDTIRKEMEKHQKNLANDQVKRMVIIYEKD